MEMEQLKKALRAQIEEYKTLAFELSDQMAREPEIGSQEYKSSAAIVKLLRDHGVEVEYPFAGYRTAFRGQICPERKVRMALLAEYDALRGLGHACGHCASGSGSVLAALAFQAFRDEYLFGVDIIGTPDEEYIGTKIGMAEKGIFDGYDFVAMVHMGPQTTAEVQFIALDGIGARWHGKPAHAAGEPWSGRNALNAARLFFDATDAMRQHIIPEARIHGIIKNGGEASNIVPELSEVEFLTRAPKRKDLDDITEWVKDCARAAALATRTEVEIGFEVYWDGDAKCVQVESGKPYTGEAPAKAEDTKSTEQPVQTDVANAKQDIIDRTNALRRENGVSALTVNAKLMQAAQVRADEMAASGVYSHTRPDGRKSNTVTDSKYTGENLHNISELYLEQQHKTLSEAVVELWSNSKAHADNMTSSRYGEIGVGLARGVDKDGLDCWYCVQVFLLDGCEVTWVDTPASK